jgi:hypothetical protein
MSRKKVHQASSSLQTGNIPIIASIVVLIAFITGLMVGSLVAVKAYGSGVSKGGGSFSQGYAVAKKRLADSGLLTNQAVSFLSGQVNKIVGEEITFSTKLLNPLDNDSLKTRIAVIGADTDITLVSLKSPRLSAADQEAIQKEITDLQTKQSVLQSEVIKCYKAMNSAQCQKVSKKNDDLAEKITEAFQKMNPYEKARAASLNEIKPGMQITVFSKEIKSADSNSSVTSQEDISSKIKFDAKRVEFMEVLPAAESIK